MAWLIAALIPAGPAAGQLPAAQDVYARHCADCHGADGRGAGPAAGLLSPRPRDFASGVYKFRSTPPGSLPTLEDLERTITRGLPGTSMPGYEGILGAPQIEALARHVLALAPPDRGRALPLEIGGPPASAAESAARGRALFERIGCAACHGRDGRGTGERPEREGPGGEPLPTDLSTPWQFRGGSDLGSVARRIAAGIDGSPMPSYDERLAPSETWDISAFVATLARRPAWEELDPARIRSAGVAADPLERGRYLVNAMLCPLCHTPISPDTGAYDTALFLAGGMRVAAYPWGVSYSRNLTPDSETGLGAWSEEAIVNAVTRGVSRGGRRLDAMAMPWPWFSRLSPADARAIAVYLRSLPPIRNPVPDPERLSMIERAGGKLLALLGAETSVDFWGGNAAAEAGLRGAIPAPPGRRGWAWALGGLTLAGTGALLIASLVPPRRSAPAVAGPGQGNPRVAAPRCRCGWPGGLARARHLAAARVHDTGADRAMALRGEPDAVRGPRSAGARAGRAGEYVAAIAPCGLCHTPAGAFIGFYTDRTLAGGMEGRWRVYGSAYSTNLTPRPEDGIGGLDDRAIHRAVASGIGRAGRRMHWQAMPWDIMSHWSEEDRRAIIAYLRALPPVAGAVPAPRGPAAGRSLRPTPSTLVTARSDESPRTSTSRRVILGR